MNRRNFLKNTTLAGAGLYVSTMVSPPVMWGVNRIARKGLPAIIGGESIHPGGWPGWPLWKDEYDQKVLDVLRSGSWFRAGVTEEFERKWAEMLGVKRALTIANGTNSLITALLQSGVTAGDEVIVTPYTFVASVQAILNCGAIPVFADIDRETFQIDPAQIEKKVTSRTKAILPVHILGMPADMNRIMSIAKKHKLIVIEDACQSHLAEYNHKKVGTIADAGCFSFQNSKNLPIGEGGAVVSDNEEFMDRCFSYHNQGFPYGTQLGEWGGSFMIGTNVRLSEYQSMVGLVQLPYMEEQANKRWENGKYLMDLIKGIPGITPVKLYPECTKAVFHLFPYRYNKEAFEGMPRDLFIRAMDAEGIPTVSGYTPLHKEPFIKAAFESTLYRKVYSKEQLDYESYMAANQCPENDAICNEESIWMSQSMLLAEKSSMEDIAESISKIQRYAGNIMRKYKKGEI